MEGFIPPTIDDELTFSGNFINNNTTDEVNNSPMSGACKFSPKSKDERLVFSIPNNTFEEHELPSVVETSFDEKIHGESSSSHSSQNGKFSSNFNRNAFNSKIYSNCSKLSSLHCGRLPTTCSKRTVMSKTNRKCNVTPKNRNLFNVVILVSQPSCRIFEVVEITYPPETTTIADLLNLIPTKCSNKSLSLQKRRGFCRPYDNNTTSLDLIDLSMKASGKERDGSCARIHCGEILIAIPEGYSGKECQKVNMLKKREVIQMLSKSQTEGLEGAANVSHTAVDRSEELKDCFRKRITIEKKQDPSIRFDTDSVVHKLLKEYKLAAAAAPNAATGATYAQKMLDTISRSNLFHDSRSMFLNEIADDMSYISAFSRRSTFVPLIPITRKSQDDDTVGCGSPIPVDPCENTFVPPISISLRTSKQMKSNRCHLSRGERKPSDLVNTIFTLLLRVVTNFHQNVKKFQRRAVIYMQKGKRKLDYARIATRIATLLIVAKYFWKVRVGTGQAGNEAFGLGGVIKSFLFLFLITKCQRHIIKKNEES